VTIGNLLAFAICTHDPDTGELTSADFAPTYRVYQDEAAEPILAGAMARLDGVNTVGFYTEQIICNSVNGFEDGRTYTVYIEATVDGVTGGISYAFVASARAVIRWCVATLSDTSAAGATVQDAALATALVSDALIGSAVVDDLVKG